MVHPENLIYQCWTGPIRDGVLASMDNMRQYAKRIGAEYQFDLNPNIAGKHCTVPAYFEWLNPVIDDKFWKWKKILSVDCDVFTVDGLTESIFDVPINDVGICTEPFQPEYRSKLKGHICRERDEKWAILVKQKYGVSMPRNEQGLLKVYNAGVVVFTQEGIRRAQNFVPFQKYIDEFSHLGRFYSIDQNYFHAMMVKHLDYTEMDNGWNSYVHFIGTPDQKPRPVNDSRDESTKMVHIQLRGADDFSEQKLWAITNSPQEQWRL